MSTTIGLKPQFYHSLQQSNCGISCLEFVNNNLMGSTGVEVANEPFGSNATTSNNLELQLNWEVTSGLEIGGWFGYTQAQQQQNGEASATILNGALTFAFPNLGAEDNLGGIIIGIPPVVSRHKEHDLITEKIPLLLRLYIV